MSDRGSAKPVRGAQLHLDFAHACRGVWRLLIGRPDFARDFDLSRAGVVQSFIPALLAFAPIMLLETLVTRAEGGKTGPALYEQIALSNLMEIAAYVGIVALLARLLGLRRWGAYLALLNWADLVFSLIFAGVSTLSLAGENGLQAVRLLWLLVLWPAQIVFTWNAARRVMGADITVTILLIVLDLALSTGADQLASLVFPS